jgi:hypothetical protein
MTDFLEVKAIRTFAVGKELKTKKSGPFKVEAGEAKQLEAQGLVDIVGEVTTEEVADEVSTDDKPVISSTRSAKKKEKPDADNEGS